MISLFYLQPYHRSLSFIYYWQNQIQQVFLQAPQSMFSKTLGWGALSANLKQAMQIHELRWKTFP